MNTKLLFTLTILLNVVTFNKVYTQITFNNTPDTVAYVDLEYEFDASATGGVTEYVLLEKPDGMYINGTGLITWTPDSIDQGTRVVVRASNAPVSKTLAYYLYVTDALPCNPNLTAYWKLEENGGPFIDFVDTDTAYIGSSAPSIAYGYIGMGQKFDPTAPSQINVPSAPAFNWATDEDFSIELWFKKGIAEFDSTAVIIGRNEGSSDSHVHWWIGVSSDDKLHFYIREGVGGADAIGGTVSDTLWHHLVAVRNASSSKIALYLDGTTEADAVYSGGGAGLETPEDLNIGYLRRGIGVNEKKQFPFEGIIDEIAIYNKAFSSTEVITEKWPYAQSGIPYCKLGVYGPIFRTIPDTIAHEDNYYSYTFEAHDPDADLLSYEVVSAPSWLTDYDEGTRTLSGTPTNSDVGTEQLSVKVTAGGVSVYQNINIRAINTNDPPSIISEPDTVMLEEEDYSDQIIVSDIDPDEHFSYSIFSSPEAAWLSVNSSGLVSGTAPLNDTASYNIILVVEDDSSVTDTQRFVLDIRNVNDAPIINDGPTYQTNEDVALVLEIDDLDYIDVDNPYSDLNLLILPGNNYSILGHTITPDENYHGNLSVPIELSDLENTGYDTLLVKVLPVNDTPYFTSTASEVAFENQQYSYQFSASDVDPEDVDSIRFFVEYYPEWLSYNSEFNYLGGKPDFYDIGTDSIIVWASDTKDSIPQKTIITVNITNHIPRFTSTPVTSVDEDDDYIYSFVIEDEEVADPVILSAPILPGWLKLNSGSNTLTGQPTNDQVGTKDDSTYVVQLKVSDGKQDSTHTFTLTVHQVNDAPVYLGQNDTIYAYSDQVISIGIHDVFVEDVDNTDDELLVIPQPGSGYIISNNSVDPLDGVTGILEVNIKISDGELESNSGKIYMRIFVTSTGVETNKDDITYMVYPIPASNKIYFKLNSVLDGAILEFINLQGSTIYNTELVTGVETEIDVNELPDGIYIYKINHQQVVQTGKFIIKH